MLFALTFSRVDRLHLWLNVLPARVNHPLNQSQGIGVGFAAALLAAPSRTTT
jgi:hypothetical protein